jgi:glyoxylase-like metal-dependent hydrolase (beta-lactamase superfamily II)
MNCCLTAVLAGAFLAWAGAAAAQQTDYSAVTVKTTDLGHHTYMLQGAGGNVTIAVGDDGVIMVDSEFAPLHEKLKAAIAAVTKQPVRYLVNTHFHGDHSGGDKGFAEEGAIVVAQINVKKRLAQGTVDGLRGRKTPGVTGDALPSKTYRNALTLKVKGRTAQLRHPANAHTDGDTYVWFAGANVLATGDTVTLGRYPNIDFANGGNIKGMIRATETYLKLANDETKIVPGHGPLGDKKAVAAYRTMLIEARSRIAKLINAGKSEQEAVAARPFAGLDTKLGANEQQSANFVRVIYHSLRP